MTYVLHHIIITMSACLFLILDRKLSRVKTNILYYIWTCLVLIYLVPFKWNNKDAVINVHQMQGSHIYSSTRVTKTTYFDYQVLMDNLFLILVVIWIIGIIFNITRYLSMYTSYTRIAKLKSIALEKSDFITYVDGNIEEYLLKRKVRVCILNKIGTPFAFGVFKPIIFFPEVSDYSSDEMNLIMEHEYNHIKRNDNLVRVLSTIVRLIFWFNPLIKLFIRKMNHYCELSCDELVLSTKTINDQVTYLDAIYKTIARNHEYTLALGSGFLWKERDYLIERVELILKRKRYSKLSSLTWSYLLVVLLGSYMLIGCVNDVTQTESIQIDTEVQGEDLDYVSLDEIAYVHVVEFESWEAVKNMKDNVILFEDSFEGITFSGNLEFTAAYLKEEGPKVDVHYTGVLNNIN